MNNRISYGLTVNAGGGHSSSATEALSPTFGLGFIGEFRNEKNLKHGVKLEYNLKQERFNNTQHYINDFGDIKKTNASIQKNNGILSLTYQLSYLLLKKDAISLSADAGIGFANLFWQRIIINAPTLEEPIVTGKTQIGNTNPLVRPSINLGLALKIPYETTKMVVIKPEFQYDYRLPNTPNTFPIFNSVVLRLSLQF